MSRRSKRTVCRWRSAFRRAMRSAYRICRRPSLAHPAARPPASRLCSRSPFRCREYAGRCRSCAARRSSGRAPRFRDGGSARPPRGKTSCRKSGRIRLCTGPGGTTRSRKRGAADRRAADRARRLDDHVREPQPEPVLAHERRDGPRLPRLAKPTRPAPYTVSHISRRVISNGSLMTNIMQRREPIEEKKSVFRKISGPNPTNYPQYVANETGSRNSFSCRFALCPLPPCPRPARFRMEFFRARFTAFETVLRDFLPDCAG